MQNAVRPLYVSLGVKGFISLSLYLWALLSFTKFIKTKIKTKISKLKFKIKIKIQN